jgi:hypothetical protein
LQHEVRNRFRLLITKRAGVIVSQPVAQPPLIGPTSIQGGKPGKNLAFEGCPAGPDCTVVW